MAAGWEVAHSLEMMSRCVGTFSTVENIILEAFMFLIIFRPLEGSWSCKAGRNILWVQKPTVNMLCAKQVADARKTSPVAQGL